MTEPKKDVDVATQVHDWARGIGERGVVGRIDPMVVRGYLESCGATFDVSAEAHKSLSRYSNYCKKAGLTEVLGKERYDSIKRKIRGSIIPASEAKYGRKFPDLYDPKTEKYDEPGTSNFSGSMQFLGELVAFASGDMGFEDYQARTERRAMKGLVWASGKRYTPSNNHPFPPEIPLKVLELLESGR